jgi:hypothetical protein
MKKVKVLVSLGFGVVVIAISVGNVILNLQQKSDLSAFTLANLEAFGEAEFPGEEVAGGDQLIYNSLSQESNHYCNNVLYKRTRIVNCYTGGSYSCHQKSEYQLKNENGTWTDWIPQ